ncbi:uncharacterized protein LOC117783693 [Drosophila innubila]|uniref:uncharacterized protein LOC117783693 n=1 Tax=Drosophila innubila TaxID=198719 RepID=UPI00148D3C62|nr:uncharacterized protein LOC117783693 [Drosophila innubila]
MDLDYLTAVLSQFNHNFEKVQQNLNDYKQNVDTMRQSLMEESWCNHVARADDVRINSVYDGLLSGINDVNEHLIKLDFRINLNLAVSNIKYMRAKEIVCKCDREIMEHKNNNKENHTNLDGIEVGELDEEEPATSTATPTRTKDAHQLMEMPENKESTLMKVFNSTEQISRLVLPIFAEKILSSTKSFNSAAPQKISNLTKSSYSVERGYTPVLPIRAQEMPKSTNSIYSAEQVSKPGLPLPAAEMSLSAIRSYSFKQMSNPILPIPAEEMPKSTNSIYSAEQVSKPVLPLPAEEMPHLEYNSYSFKQMSTPMLPIPAEEMLKSTNSIYSAEQVSKPGLPLPGEEMPHLGYSTYSSNQMSTPVLPLPEEEIPRSSSSSNLSKQMSTPMLPIPTEDPADQLSLPVLPIPARQTALLPPKGGRKMSRDETYKKLSKNLSNFPNDSIVQVKMMHINILEKCIFIGKWGEDSVGLRELMACEVPIKELDQFPDFGKIFGVYDAQDQIISRVLINAPAEAGGYDAYLPDYGEHVHLNEYEMIFGLPKDIADLPAEAIRCNIHNQDVNYMRQFIYKDVRLRILDNNNIDLVAELLEDATELENHLDRKLGQSYEESAVVDKASVKSPMKLSQRDMEMMEYDEPTTSNAVKAVLGFNPTDDKRICRHYDPKIGGCFKGSNCRLLHEPRALHGATKDKELSEALPEIRYESFVNRELSSIVRVQVTYINSPTQLYVQFADETSPLVWSKIDVPDSERKFKRNPLPLDMVLALYHDGYYYRAQILEELNGIFKIFYVDYGNTEIVTIKSLAQCNNIKSLKPHRAVSCFIEGVKHIPWNTPGQANECVEFLKSKLLNCEFDVKLISRMPDGYVIKFLNHHADICNEMLEYGMPLTKMDKQFIIIMVVGIIIFVATGLGVLWYLKWKIRFK